MASSIWAIIKALPIALKLFRSIVKIYNDEQVKAITDTKLTINDEITILYSKVFNAKTNKERLTLVNAIDRINNPT